MEPTVLRAGAHGAAVVDLQERLRATGYPVVATGRYDDATSNAVLAFQTARGLQRDGVCGPETWDVLVESGYRLGDRLLYLRRPMLRGDDIADLQRRCNALGFDAGSEDGILGPETERAIRQFQRNAGLATDGVCGPATIGALDRLGSLAAGSVASVRERDALRRDERRLRDRAVFLVSEPGLDALATEAARGLRAAGAIVAHDDSGQDHHTLAAEANRFQADLCVAIGGGLGPGARCAYFATARFRSEGGLWLATALHGTLSKVLDVDAPVGRSYPLLRETRMAAVVCELYSRDDPDGAAGLAMRVPDVVTALTEGIRVGAEPPPV
ncbi:MAG: peptidoglycan-binding protein [Actinomycetota bacterium]